MEMMVSTEDMNYLAQQSSDRISIILAGMTSLMNDTDQKVEVMESQTWFQRMVKTITGKNKLAKEEIQQNHDKLNAYMSQAMAELYNRDCINQEIMMSLGNQINELYADHLQLKEMLGAFVTKLNEKIESIDNFHMLNTEIEQGVYSGYESIVAICLVMSQMDKRVLEDNRKLDILKRSMQNQGILEQSDMMLTDFLLSIINMPDDKVGLIYMELGSIPENFVAKLVLDTIESYHFLPDMAKKMKNKNSVVTNIIENNQLDDGIALNISDVYDDFMESKCNFTCVSMTNNLKSVDNDRIYPDKSNVKIMMQESAESLISVLEYSYYYVEAHQSQKCECEEALNTLKTFAKKGDAEAQYYLGKAYINAEEDEEFPTFFSYYEGKNIELGYKYIEESAKQGYPDARIYMAPFYAMNDDREKGRKILEELMEESQEQSSEMMFALAKVLCKGNIFKLTCFWDENEDITETDAIKIVDLLKKCVELKHEESVYWLSQIYLSDKLERIGYMQDLKRYKEYLELAVDLENKDAIYELAQNYYNGMYSYSVNWKKAFELFDHPKLIGDGETLHMQGKMLWNGEGVETNKYLAVSRFEEAVKKREFADDSYTFLIQAYYTGEGCWLDYDERTRMEMAEKYINKLIREDSVYAKDVKEWREAWFGY